MADFGIALAVSAAGGTRLTDTGLSLGTPEYMSPEQVTCDRELDVRSDLYSLGAVVYEMLVGEPPHTGKTAQAIIAKVVSAEPQPVSTVRQSVPNNVEAAVMCAVAKIPADRFASVTEFVNALTNPAFALPTQLGDETLRQGQGRWKRMAIGLAGLAALLAGTTLWSWMHSPSESSRVVVRATIPLPEGEEVQWAVGTHLAFSPDGTRVVYTGQGEGRFQLWLRELDEIHGNRLPGTGGAGQPFFSPDGKNIAFRDDRSGALKIVSTDGAPPETIVESVRPDCGDWGPDGMLYFGAIGGGISRISTSGGDPEVLTRPDTSRGELAHRSVHLLPNGKGALFTIWRGQVEDEVIAVVEFETGEVRLLARGFHPKYASSGHLVFMQSTGVLSAAPFDQDRFLLGPVTTLDEGVSGSRGYDLSETGSLVYMPSGEDLVRPIWVDRDGLEQIIDPEWIGGMYFPALSPDGSHLSVSIGGPDGRHIWIKTLDGGPLQRFTFEGLYNQPSVWSPDGQTLTFGSRSAGHNADIWQKRVDGTGPATLVLDLEQSIRAIIGSTDGSWLVIRAGTESNPDLFGFRPDVDSVPIPLVTTEHAERSPALSPDMHWLGYTSDETRTNQVYVRPFPNVEEGKWQVSLEGGEELLWAQNGRELFYRNAKDEMVVGTYVTEPTFAVVSRRVLFPVTGYRFVASNHTYAVSPDDQRFILLKWVEQLPQRELRLVLNFFEELKEEVGL